jgi:hypothetical protein
MHTYRSYIQVIHFVHTYTHALHAYICIYRWCTHHTYIHTKRSYCPNIHDTYIYIIKIMAHKSNIKIVHMSQFTHDRDDMYISPCADDTRGSYVCMDGRDTVVSAYIDSLMRASSLSVTSPGAHDPCTLALRIHIRRQSWLNPLLFLVIHKIVFTLIGDRHVF